METKILVGQNIGSLTVFRHPEIGWCAVDNGGAQSEGSAYDQGQRPGAVVSNCKLAQKKMRQGILDATLASDGWWWRVCHPWRYGLPD